MANPFALAVRQMQAPAPRAESRPMRLRAGTWDGAEGGRLLGSWSAPLLSANQEVELGLRVLRARARDLVRNNPWVAGVVREIATQVIGPEGIRLVPQNRNRAGALATATNVEIARAWAEWGNPEFASADEHDSWIDIQRLAVETMVTDGEAFVQKIRGADNPFGFTLRLIDADLVDDTFNRRATDGRNEIRMGVEIDGLGKPVAYHVLSEHPSEPGKRVRTAVPAAEIRHLFIRRRPGQVRGLTHFAPVVADLKMLDGYEWSELVAARTAAAKMGFIVNKNPEAIADYQSELDAAGEDADGRLRMDAEPGVIDELDPGKEFVGFDPTHPSTAYKEFVAAILRGIARGLGVSYVTLTGDLTAVNYSSIRAGMLAERDMWRALQKWLSTHLHRPVYREWVSMALMNGALRVDSRLASDYTTVAWKPRGWQWVDPLKDIQAAEREIALGLNSRTKLAAERGLDFEEVVDELRAEADYADAEGVDVSGVEARGVAPAPSGEDDAPQRAPVEGAPSAATLRRLRAIS